MELEIRPEPDDAERQAIITVLVELEDDSATPYRSAWRVAAAAEIAAEGGP